MSGLVKWFSFSDMNAPQLNNAWGAMTNVLNACLIDGFGSRIVSTYVVGDGVATVDFGIAHGFKQFQVVAISGATNAALNGEFKITGLTSNTIEFITTAPPQTATGTISAMLAPLGWTKEFSGTNKAVYRAKDTVANPYYLRVDNSLDPVYGDTYAKFAKVGMLETCTGIDDISGNQAPYNAGNPTLNWVGTGTDDSSRVGWAKWYYAYNPRFDTNDYGNQSYSGAQNGNRDWILVGNDQSFYLFNALDVRAGKTNYRTPYGFFVIENEGVKITSLACALLNISSSDYIDPISILSEFNVRNAQNIITMQDATGSHTTASYFNFYANKSMYSGYDTGLIYDPARGLMIDNIYAKDSANRFAGKFDLLKYVAVPESNFTDLQLVTDAGRAYLVAKARQTDTSSTNLGCFAFDLGEI